MRLCGALLNSGEIDDGANDSAAAHNFVTGVGFHVEGEEAAVDFGQASRGLDHRSLRGGLKVVHFDARADGDFAGVERGIDGVRRGRLHHSDQGGSRKERGQPWIERSGSVREEHFALKVSFKT